MRGAVNPSKEGAEPPHCAHRPLKSEVLGSEEAAFSCAGPAFVFIFLFCLTGDIQAVDSARMPLPCHPYRHLLDRPAVTMPQSPPRARPTLILAGSESHPPSPPLPAPTAWCAHVLFHAQRQCDCRPLPILLGTLSPKLSGCAAWRSSAAGPTATQDPTGPSPQAHHLSVGMRRGGGGSLRFVAYTNARSSTCACEDR